MNSFVNSNPSEIARETLKQLALLKIPPTPDSYHKLYDQIAGLPENQISAAAAKMLTELAKEFPRHTPSLLNCANRLEQAANEKNWLKYKSALIKFAASESTTLDSATPPLSASYKPVISWGEIIQSLFNELDNKKNVSQVANKRKNFKQIVDEFSGNPEILQGKLIALIQSWKKPAPEKQGDTVNEPSPCAAPTEAAGENSFPSQDILVQENEISGYTGQLLEILTQMLEQIIASQISDATLSGEARRLAHQVRKIANKLGMERFIAEFQQFCIQFESCHENKATVQHGLLKLLNVLMESAGELLSEDQWIRTQLLDLKKTMAEPLTLPVITQAEAVLVEIIQRQTAVKQNLGKARSVMRQVVTSLISNLEELSDTTGGYHGKLEYFSAKINQVDDIEGINQLLAEIMRETQQVQKNVLNYHHDLSVARAEMDKAQSQINRLETQLQVMNEKTQQDHLTGALNRRGFDQAYRREIAQATHSQGPLCIALLDIDNFKQLNDTHGHQAGDDALIYLVEAVKETIRREDIISRYGGEEFAILLPDTALEEAISTVSRIRRYLTKKFFLHENNRLLITFSAGVAQYQAGESQESFFARADAALYCAKKNGKNQIVVAEEKTISGHCSSSPHDYCI